MFRPTAFFIGLRYTHAKRRHRFISLISLISMLGIALGVIVLITILSVVNGFDREIKKQIFNMVSPLTVTSYSGQIEDWTSLEKSLKQTKHVTAVAPFAFGQALLTNSNVTQAAIIAGILPEKENEISSLSKKMVTGQLTALLPHKSGIILGEELAKHLKVAVGDSLTLVTPRGAISTTSINTQSQKFTVVGIFRAGGASFGFDTKFAFIHLTDAQQFFDLGKSITALHVNLDDMYLAPTIAQDLSDHSDPMLRFSDWTEQLGGFFENIRSTKAIMFFIFILIIAVAAFNLVCTLVMVVKNKEADIAILRTMGATPLTILSIFIVQGAIIGLGGVTLGVLGGIALTWKIPEISIWIQDTLHMELISPSVYFINYLPSELQWNDITIISIATLILSLVATLYPAWTASRVSPIEAMRGE